MKLKKLIAALSVLGASLLFSAGSQAAEPAKDLFLKGDAKCTSCHDETDAPGVLHLGKTKHGTRADGRTPTCTNCHGESDKHANYKGKDKPPKPDVAFSGKAKHEAEAKNESCTNCHQKDAKRMFWQGSQHQNHDITCTSCHDIHAGKDKVRDKATQPEVCFTCHKEQRALANKPSHHPVIEGKMTCSDCHNVHGSAGPKLLIKDSTNQTCYTCHAEKRGPYIHNHQPVTDDCSNCHNPHGTTADTMLKTRAPFLCLSCHEPASHLGQIPGVAGRVDMSRNANGRLLSGTATTTTPVDQYQSSGVVGKTQGMSCMNCHTNIHGSNDPMNSTRAERFWR